MKLRRKLGRSDHLCAGRSAVPAALRVLARGGTVVCGGIRMSDIPSFPSAELWQERTICSVANLTRRDGEEFLALAPRVPVRTETQTFPSSRRTKRSPRSAPVR